MNRARSSFVVTLAVMVAYACGVQAPAVSASDSPRSVGPASGAILPLGVPPTFVVRDGRDHIATLEVSASRHTDTDGVFTTPLWSMGYVPRKGKDITVSPQRSSSPRRFWNTPGTYYWHVDVLDCGYLGPRPHTCTHHVTRTRSFTIRSKRQSRL